MSLAILVVLLAAGLAGCGHDSSAATTTACRSYALGGGAGDHQLITDLKGAVAAGSWDTGPLLVEVRAVRSGAGTAGATKGLSAADYRLFRNVVSAMVTAESYVAPVNNSSGALDSSVIAGVNAAVGAVHKRCD
ncbi:MAG: hypothetical protein JWR52_3525 [Marmoricola sp.]|nr:hypothetical protein [Marmoricola sp.]